MHLLKKTNRVQPKIFFCREEAQRAGNFLKNLQIAVHELALWQQNSPSIKFKIRINKQMKKNGEQNL